MQTAVFDVTDRLVTLLSSGYEVQYVALQNILLIIQRRPLVLRNDVKVFFCKYNDPIYVKLAKLEIIYRLANEKNVEQVLAELKEWVTIPTLCETDASCRYASEVDIDFVRKAVRSIGRLAIKISRAADLCIAVLVALVETKVNYVVQEAIVVIKDIFRRYPNQYEGIIGTLCENLDALDTPDAKAAMIWIIGQYADRIENSDELLDDFLFTFLEEPVEVRRSSRCDSLTSVQVQLALLTATVKLFIKRPTAGQELVPKVLKWATEDVDNPDLRDRGYIYWRLLSTDPGAANDIILAEKPPISTETEAMDRGVLDRLLLHTGTLASLYGKEPQTFIRGAKAKYLQDSPALDPSSKQSFLASLNLPVHTQPQPASITPSSSMNVLHSSPAPPALPPKPLRQDSTLSTTEPTSEPLRRPAQRTEEDEDEDAALNPSAPLERDAPLEYEDDALDPYASLARLSTDGFGGTGILAADGGGLRSAENEYATGAAFPLSGRGLDAFLL